MTCLRGRCCGRVKGAAGHLHKVLAGMEKADTTLALEPLEVATSCTQLHGLLAPHKELQPPAELCVYMRQSQTQHLTLRLHAETAVAGWGP